MKYFLLFLSLLGFNYYADAKKYDYTEYHTMIAEAENALTKEDFKTSLQIYKKAFEDYPFKFACDIYHAIQVALILKSDVDCKNLLDTCFAYGIPLKCLHNAPLIHVYLEPKPKNEIDKQIIFYNKLYEARIDIKLQNEWKERFNCEQAAKRINDKNESYMVCLKDNYTALKKYISTNKYFPGEKTMGICSDNSAGSYIGDNCGLSNEIVTPTMHHTGISFADLKMYLDMSLENGSLNPRDYMYMLQFEKGTGKEQTGFKKYYNAHQQNIDFSCYSLCFNMGWGVGCKDNQFANECRKKIGVCSVETDQLKYDIKKKYGFVFLNIM